MKKDNETESIQLRLELFDSESGHQGFTLEDLEEHDFIISGFDDEVHNSGDQKPSRSGTTNKNKLNIYKSKRIGVLFYGSVYGKKLIKLKASRSRLTLSEFCRRASSQMEVKERLSQDHIETYKNLVGFRNDLRSLLEMARNNDSGTSEAP